MLLLLLFVQKRKKERYCRYYSFKASLTRTQSVDIINLISYSLSLYIFILYTYKTKQTHASQSKTKTWFSLSLCLKTKERERDTLRRRRKKKKTDADLCEDSHWENHHSRGREQWHHRQCQSQDPGLFFFLYIYNFLKFLYSNSL